MAEKELTRDLTKEEVAEFKEAFDMFDMDGGGSWLLRLLWWLVLDFNRSPPYSNSHSPLRQVQLKVTNSDM